MGMTVQATQHRCTAGGRFWAGVAARQLVTQRAFGSIEHVIDLERATMPYSSAPLCCAAVSEDDNSVTLARLHRNFDATQNRSPRVRPRRARHGISPAAAGCGLGPEPGSRYQTQRLELGRSSAQRMCGVKRAARRGRAMYGAENEDSRLKVPPPSMWLTGPIMRLPRWSVWSAVLLPGLFYLALNAAAYQAGKVWVRGYVVERGAAGVAALRLYGQQWPLEPVTLHVGPYAMRYTRAELGASMPVERVCTRLSSLASAGLAGIDFGTLLRFNGRGVELELFPVIVRSSLAVRLSELRKRVEHQPIAGMIMADGSVLPGIPGFTIDFANAVDAVTRALYAEQSAVQIAGRSVAPPEPVRYGSDGPGRFTYSMVSFETKYRTTGPASGRAHNVEMAAARLDSVVIAPRGELSFNAVVGERSYARGFAGAKEIAARRIVDGIGGGVCQVAATLHAAAFLGGFDLPEYQPHSRPAHYIELGLDTMVSWPAQDMRIANPYPFPVRVRALARDGSLRITLEGAAKANFVEWSTRILSRVKPGVQQVIDDSLAPGESEVVQEAIDGLTVRRVRTIYLPTGPHREEAVLKYPPNDRIIAIGSNSGRTRRHAHQNERISRLMLDDF